MAKDINSLYKIRLEKWKNTNWVHTTMFGEAFTVRRVIERFEPRFLKELEVVHRGHFPRKRVIQIKNLPESLISPVREKWMKIAESWYLRTIKLNLCLGSWLDNNAPEVSLLKAEYFNEIKSVSSSTYNSQGFGRYKYAKHSLDQYLDLLLNARYSANIVEEEGEFDVVYKLVANCEPYILDVLQRRNPFDELEWAINCWRNGVNPKVYNPFLDNDIYEKSMAQM